MLKETLNRRHSGTGSMRRRRRTPHGRGVPQTLLPPAGSPDSWSLSGSPGWVWRTRRERVEWDCARTSTCYAWRHPRSSFIAFGPRKGLNAERSLIQKRLGSLIQKRLGGPQGQRGARRRLVGAFLRKPPKKNFSGSTNTTWRSFTGWCLTSLPQHKRGRASSLLPTQTSFFSLLK